MTAAAKIRTDAEWERHVADCDQAGRLLFVDTPPDADALRRALVVYGVATLPNLSTADLLRLCRTAINARIGAVSFSARDRFLCEVVYRCFTCWEQSTSATTWCPFCGAPHDEEDA